MPKLLLLRHAPAIRGDLLVGRTEVDADVSDRAALNWMAARVQGVKVISSPARRCLQTAAAMDLSPDQTIEALREQDFGAWDGRNYQDLPDLGTMTLPQLSAHRPPEGESFQDMAARVTRELAALTQDTLVIGHAGTVRAALSLVVGPAALAFAIAPLSLTILSRMGNDWAVELVNLTGR